VPTSRAPTAGTENYCFIVDLVKQYPKQFLTHYIPFNSDIEKMGVYLQPVIHTSATGTAALAYQALFDELLAKLR
jgi:hypothetical protein